MLYEDIVRSAAGIIRTIRRVRRCGGAPAGRSDGACRGHRSRSSGRTLSEAMSAPLSEAVLGRPGPAPEAVPAKWRPAGS